VFLALEKNNYLWEDEYGDKMDISLFAYAVSTLISLIFLIRIILVLNKKSSDLSHDFFYFFLFGTCYFSTRAISLIFLLDKPLILAYAYPISHIFLYLSFSFMLHTALQISKYRRYAKKAFKYSLIISSIILIMNFVMINKPTYENGLVDWGTNGLVSIAHLLYALISLLAIVTIFMIEARKSKTMKFNYYLIAIGFAFLPLSVLKHFFPTSLLYIFEFNMIFGISIVALGLSLKKKVLV
jgi:hypothetical protein